MRVQIHMLSQSRAVERECLNAYTKDGLYCIYMSSGAVEKYPLVNIFRISEEYTA